MKQIPELYPHQNEYLEQHAYDPYHALFWEPRTGKSKAIVHNIDILRSHSRIDCAIIVAPNVVHLQWANEEIPKHSTMDDPIIYTWDTARTKDPKEIDRIRKLIDSDEFVWFVFSTAAVTTDRARAIFRRIIKKRDDIFLCVDESHNYASPSSQRGRMMRVASKNMRYTRILSGTPVHNNPLHLWAQYELLKPGLLGFKTYGGFLVEYTEPIAYNAPRYVKPRLKNIDNLWEKAVVYATQLKAEDCMNLPDRIFRNIKVDMLPIQIKASRDLMSVKLTQYERHTMTVNHVITMLQSLQKISSGFITDENTNEKVDLMPFAELPKLVRLEDELPFAEGNIIVWAWYRHDIARLVYHFKNHSQYEIYQMSGGMSDNDKKIALRAMNTVGPKQKILIAQPRVAGTGLTYTEIGTTFWFSHTMDGIIREQANARGLKVGGSPLTIIDLECGHADDRILQSHRDKKELVDDFIQTFEDLRHAY